MRRGVLAIGMAGVAAAVALAGGLASVARASAESGAGASRPMVPDVGLDFPGSDAVSTTMRFRFRDPLPIYPATYIWRAYPRRQAGYYTAFFWGNDDGRGTLDTFLWTPDGKADSYYGAHPYPQPPVHGEDHKWELAIKQDDILQGEVVYDRWHIQALRVWSTPDGKHHEFYWNLPRTDARHRVAYTTEPGWGNVDPPAPTLTWGDAPWAPGNEVWNGMLTGIQIYSATLSLEDIRREIAEPLSTERGAESIWYLNLTPTPDDIADHSGNGNHPEWVGSERPDIWARESP